jgi:hypothetical protein
LHGFHTLHDVAVVAPRCTDCIRCIGCITLHSFSEQGCCPRGRSRYSRAAARPAQIRAEQQEQQSGIRQRQERAGQGTYTYSYTTSTNPAGFNSWAVKPVETLPDGNQNIVYTNAYAEPMLRVYVDAGSGQKWMTFDEYDSQGRIILEAQPSAVTGYDDTHADLLNYQSGSYQYLATSTGLIDTWTYAASTTATETTPGNAAGYLEEDAVQQGQQGTPVEQDSALYFQHTGGNLTIDPVASSTVYRNTDGTGGETTSDAYTWVSGTVGMASDTTTLPVISAAQNGPGTADSQETVFDSYGRPVWSKDADGFINYTAYDPATGAVVKTITDVDTTKTGDFTGLPTGWSTPTGGGLHLITQYVVDSQGRPTEETDPNGNVNYIVYDDINHETRTYIGWNSSTLTATGPTEVMRDDLSGSSPRTLCTRSSRCPGQRARCFC